MLVKGTLEVYCQNQPVTIHEKIRNICILWGDLMCNSLTLHVAWYVVSYCRPCWKNNSLNAVERIGKIKKKFPTCNHQCSCWLQNTDRHPDSKAHGANMGPTWVLSSPGGPHVGPMNLATGHRCWASAWTVMTSPYPVHVESLHLKGYI